MKKISTVIGITGIILLVAASLAGAAVYAYKIPLQQVILDPECTIDTVVTDTGHETVTTCPVDPEDEKPVTPDPGPNVPEKPKGDVGSKAPDTGVYGVHRAVWLFIVGIVVPFILIFFMTRKRRTAEKGTTKKTGKDSSKRATRKK